MLINDKMNNLKFKDRILSSQPKSRSCATIFKVLKLVFDSYNTG